MSPVLDLNQTHLYQAFSVLVVDDEVGMQLVLKKALSKWFSRVDLAGSIEDAEVLRGEHHYDLLIHAMNGKGRITIRSEDWVEEGQNRGAVIHIEDQGCGIKPENLKRIFDPFYTTKREGTGLGLSVSQSLLSQSGGEIKVQSELGVGSTFSIFLPSKNEAKLRETLLLQ